MKKHVRNCYLCLKFLLFREYHLNLYFFKLRLSINAYIIRYFLRILTILLLYIALWNRVFEVVNLLYYQKLFLMFIIAVPSFLYFRNLYLFSNVFFGSSRRIVETYKYRNNKKKVFPRNKHFVGLMALLAFYSGMLVALEYLKAIPESLNIPDIKGGTIGLRAWRSKVLITELSIKYENKEKKWITIPDTTISNPNNWVKPTWLWLGKGVKSIMEAKVNFIDKTIEIENCGIVFHPINYEKVYNNVRLDVKFMFTKVEKDESKHSGFNLSLHVDTAYEIVDSAMPEQVYKIPNHETTYNVIDCSKVKPFINLFFEIDTVFKHYIYNVVSPLCIEFALPFYDWPHPWIPALDWKPGIIQRSKKEDLEKYGGFDTKVKKIQISYDVAAYIYDDQVRFIGKNFGSCSLFESKIDKHQGY